MRSDIRGQESQLRIERTNIENNIPTTRRYEWALTRERDYELSEAIYRNNRRGADEMIKWLEQEIATLEWQVAEIMAALR